MPDDTIDLNDTSVEAPGDTQATHSAGGRKRTGRGTRGPRAKQVVAYVRDNDMGEIRGDLERQIREHPLRSIAVALVGGYLLSKLID